MDPLEFGKMVETLKALSDANRLRMVGLLAQRPRAVEELAAATGLSAPTVSHHLSCLRAVGLVSSEREQYYAVYRLDRERLQRLGQRLGGLSTALAPPVGSQPADPYDQEVLATFLVGNRLTSLPRQRKKREAILRYLVEQFAIDRVYSEPEVNAVLGVFHDDVATLRRELVGYNLLDRSQGQYRRPQ